MTKPTPASPRETDAEIARLRDQVKRLQSQNEKLRSEYRELQLTIDARRTRLRDSLYGSVEMTAGTSTGPRRRRARGET